MRILKILLTLILSFSVLLCSFVFSFASSLPLGVTESVHESTTSGSYPFYSFNSFVPSSRRSPLVTYKFSSGDYSFVINFNSLSIPCFGISTNISGDISYSVDGEDVSLTQIYSGYYGYSCPVRCHLVVPEGSTSTLVFYYVFSSTSSVSSEFDTINKSISPITFISSTYPKYSNVSIPVPAGYIFIWDREAAGADSSSVVSLKLHTDVPFKKGFLSSLWRNGVLLDYNNISVQNIIDTASFYGPGNINWRDDSTGGQTVNVALHDHASRYVFVVNPSYSVHNNNSYRNDTLYVTMCGADGYSIQGRVGTYRCFSLTSELVDGDFSNYVADYSASYLWAPDYDSDGKALLTDDGYAIGEGWKAASSLAGGTSESWDDSTSTGQVIDDESNVQPPSGGNNEVAFQQQVYNNYDLSGLFQYGNGSVHQVVNSGQGFFSFLSNLWSWLPPQIMTIIVSILSIFLIVGAVKLFL